MGKVHLKSFYGLVGVKQYKVTNILRTWGFAPKQVDAFCYYNGSYPRKERPKMGHTLGHPVCQLSEAPEGKDEFFSWLETTADGNAEMQSKETALRQADLFAALFGLNRTDEWFEIRYDITRMTRTRPDGTVGENAYLLAVGAKLRKAWRCLSLSSRCDGAHTGW